MNLRGHLGRRTFLHLMAGVSTAAFARGALAQAIGLQDMGTAAVPSPSARIYVAKQILTMDPTHPQAEAVAVVNDRIAAVGTLSELQRMAGEQPFEVVSTFRDKVIIAGFVEQHVHPVLAALTMPSVVISIEPWDTVGGFSDQVRDEPGYQARLKEALAAHIDPSKVFVT